MIPLVTVWIGRCGAQHLVVELHLAKLGPDCFCGRAYSSVRSGDIPSLADPSATASRWAMANREATP